MSKLITGMVPTQALVRLVLFVSLSVVCITPSVFAATFQTVYTFPSGKKFKGTGGLGLVLGRKGLLYGLTSANGSCDQGSIYQFNPIKISSNVVASLCKNGSNPVGTPVVGSSGILYGATEIGGQGNCPNGCGTLFQLDLATHTLIELYEFLGLADGGTPLAGPTLGTHGTLYGTTSYGGSRNCGQFGCGVIFKFDPATGVLTTLYSFTGKGDGAGPNTALVADGRGAFYGTTVSGPGSCDCGTIFEFDPTKKKPLTTLYVFTGPSGSSPPSGGLLLAGGSTLYGTTGGYRGTLFELDLATRTLTTLHAFSGSDGAWPQGPMALDAAQGMLYGVTGLGGDYPPNCYLGCGTVFALNLATGTLTGLHDFTGGADGKAPNGGLAYGSDGGLYGTTTFEGGSEVSTVFKVTP